MDKPNLSTTFLGRILAKTGGFFLILAVFSAQLIPNIIGYSSCIFYPGEHRIDQDTGPGRQDFLQQVHS